MDEVTIFGQIQKRNIEEYKRILKQLGLSFHEEDCRVEPKPVVRRTMKRALSESALLVARQSTRRLSVRIRHMNGKNSFSDNEHQYYDSCNESDLEESTENRQGERKSRKQYIYGPIPGIEVGASWKFRLTCSRDGVHRPPVAGIHGGPEGAYSLALSGGYAEDVDRGNSFTYIGAGGRNFRGRKLQPKNLRRVQQVKDQTLDGVNAALIRSIETRQPVRVIRGYKLKGPFAPDKGYRYDGLYKVQRHWTAIGESGFKVIKFHLQRCPGQAPPPWLESDEVAVETSDQETESMSLHLTDDETELGSESLFNNSTNSSSNGVSDFIQRNIPCVRGVQMKEKRLPRWDDCFSPLSLTSYRHNREMSKSLDDLSSLRKLDSRYRNSSDISQTRNPNNSITSLIEFLKNHKDRVDKMDNCVVEFIARRSVRSGKECSGSTSCLHRSEDAINEIALNQENHMSELSSVEEDCVKGIGSSWVPLTTSSRLQTPFESTLCCTCSVFPCSCLSTTPTAQISTKLPVATSAVIYSANTGRIKNHEIHDLAPPTHSQTHQNTKRKNEFSCDTPCLKKRSHNITYNQLPIDIVDSHTDEAYDSDYDSVHSSNSFAHLTVIPTPTAIKNTLPSNSLVLQCDLPSGMEDFYYDHYRQHRVEVEESLNKVFMVAYEQEHFESLQKSGTVVDVRSSSSGKLDSVRSTSPCQNQVEKSSFERLNSSRSASKSPAEKNSVARHRISPCGNQVESNIQLLVPTQLNSPRKSIAENNFDKKIGSSRRVSPCENQVESNIELLEPTQLNSPRKSIAENNFVTKLRSTRRISPCGNHVKIRVENNCVEKLEQTSRISSCENQVESIVENNCVEKLELTYCTSPCQIGYESRGENNSDKTLESTCSISPCENQFKSIVENNSVKKLKSTSRISPCENRVESRIENNCVQKLESTRLISPRKIRYERRVQNNCLKKLESTRRTRPCVNRFESRVDNSFEKLELISPRISLCENRVESRVENSWVENLESTRRISPSKKRVESNSIDRSTILNNLCQTQVYDNSVERSDLSCLNSLCQNRTENMTQESRFETSREVNAGFRGFGGKNLKSPLIRLAFIIHDLQEEIE